MNNKRWFRKSIRRKNRKEKKNHLSH